MAKDHSLVLEQKQYSVVVTDLQLCALSLTWRFFQQDQNSSSVDRKFEKVEKALDEEQWDHRNRFINISTWPISNVVIRKKWKTLDYTGCILKYEIFVICFFLIDRY